MWEQTISPVCAALPTKYQITINCPVTVQKSKIFRKMIELANRICLRLLLGISVPSYHLVLLLSGRPVPILSPLVRHWRRKRARKRWQHWGNCGNNELLRLKFLVGSWATVLGGDTTKWNTTPQFLFHTILINGCDSSATSPNKQPPSNLNIMYKMLVESKERRKGEGVIFRVDALKSPHIGSFSKMAARLHVCER